MDLLLSERNKKQNKDSHIYISDEEMVDDIKTFVVGGSDTTSNTLTAMILLVFEHPKVLERLRKEIDSVIHCDADITVENFKKLAYLECVIN